jgi:hypothetical protein
VAVPGFSFADEHEREVGERSQVAAGADRSTGRDHRMHAAIQELDEQLERVQPDAREPLGQHVGSQRHGCADDRHRQRVADAGGMTAEQIGLQLGERLGRNFHLGKVAEAGVDAVGRLVSMREFVDQRAGGTDARAGCVSDMHRRRVVGDGEHLLERQAGAVKLNCKRHIGHF